VTQVIGGLRGIELTSSLRDGPFPGESVYRDSRPALTVLVCDVDEQSIPVVFDANFVRGVTFFLQAAHHATADGASNE
jgi:hypothetical protein